MRRARGLLPPQSLVLAFLGLAVARVLAYGSARDARMVETLLKMAETRLASRSDYSEMSQERRYGLLLGFVRDSGAGVPGSATARMLPPEQLASALTEGRRPEELRGMIQGMRGLLDRMGRAGGAPAGGTTASGATGGGRSPRRGRRSPPAPGGAAPGGVAPGGAAPGGAPVTGGRTANAARSYVLGPNDVIDLVFLDPEIAPNQKVKEAFSYKINLEGKAVLPLLGVVQVAGYTVAQLRDHLRELYREFIQDPRITVFVNQYNSQKVYVMGENGAANVVKLTGERLTLFDLLTQVGGYGEAGDAEHILVFRGSRRLVVNFKEHLDDPMIAERFVMFPGDRVVIPRPTSKVTILGGVNKAGTYQFRGGLTLLKLVAEAESFSDNARRERIKIIRQSSGQKGRDIRKAGQPATQTLNVNALDILKGKRSDIFLQAHDTVYVDEW